jgi:hypothetical protein
MITNRYAPSAASVAVSVLCTAFMVLFSFNTPAFAQGSWYEIANSNGQAVTLGEMVFDSKRGVIVQFGGSGTQDEQWEYDGTKWTQRTDIELPRGRRGHAMAYDSHRGVIVMFGGLAIGAGIYLNDTWEFDGNTWRQIDVSGPVERYNHRMVYDSDRRVVVLVGGSDYSKAIWEYNGSSWTMVSDSAPFNGRSGPGLAYDPIRKLTVLFGGTSYSNGVTWEKGTWGWDGSQWIQLAGEDGGPDERTEFCMVYDSNWGRIHAFGGTRGSAVYYNDHWTWDGSQWVQIDVGTPGYLSQYNMAFDSRRSRLVLQGGFEYQKGTTDRTFEYDSGYRPPGADLMVTGVSCSGGKKGLPGEIQTVSVDVANQGVEDAGEFRVQLSEDKEVLDSRMVDKLNVGGKTTLEFRYVPLAKGKVTISAVADPQAMVTDTDRSNNAKSTKFKIKKAKGDADLVISHVEVLPAAAASPSAKSKTVKVKFVITNVGRSDSVPFTYHAYITAKGSKVKKKDTLVVEQYVEEGLESGEQIVINKTVEVKKMKKKFYFYGLVDVDEEVEENYEDNNEVVKQYSSDNF